MGKQDKGLGAAPPNLPALMPNAHGKQTNKIVLVTLWFCLRSFFIPQSTYSLKAATKVHTRGMNCPQCTFWMGGFGCSCWCVLRTSKHSKYTVKWHQSLALSPHLQLCSYGPEESRDTWSCTYLCCVSLQPREASQCPGPEFPLDILHPKKLERLRLVVPFLWVQ